jgi:hypothetical protein
LAIWEILQIVWRVGFVDRRKETVLVVLCMYILPDGYYRRGDDLLVDIDIESFWILIYSNITD